MEGKLKIIYWNASTLRGKARRVNAFLQDHRADILLVSETHLRPSDIFKIPNYHIYRKDEVSPSGQVYRGLAVLVQRRVIHQLIPVTEYGTFQALGILINVAGKIMRIHSIYRPPGTSLDKMELRSLFDGNIPTIVAGDLNSKHTAWHSSKICTTGRILSPGRWFQFAFYRGVDRVA
ncbi:unnamed protein product [Leptidea sinapis]|uniref:Endonuclease/exonuclease/phosphatase domain-containing protein n=1 Tax=Leptidea sinapis TaxID=189913 RepID=A0A5E4Q4V3_9NEOP|nr:unnamed protein product [Leptidea sinapis]